MESSPDAFDDAMCSSPPPTTLPQMEDTIMDDPKPRLPKALSFSGSEGTSVVELDIELSSSDPLCENEKNLQIKRPQATNQAATRRSIQGLNPAKPKSGDKSESAKSGDSALAKSSWNFETDYQLSSDSLAATEDLVLPRDLRRKHGPSSPQHGPSHKKTRGQPGGPEKANTDPIFARFLPEIPDSVQNLPTLPVNSPDEPGFARSDPDLTPAKRNILKARDLIMEAYTLCESRDEQSKLLDLLEIFRDYTERGQLAKASHIIASQVANLETATRHIETQARELAKVNKPSPANTQTTYASMARKDAPTMIEQAQNWKTVGPKRKNTTPEAKDTPVGKGKRIILVQSTQENNKEFSPLTLRNAINNAFAKKGVTELVINAVNRTRTQNIAITTTNTFSADYLIEKQSIWQHLIPYKSIQKDEAWYKVVLHGVSTRDFNTEGGPKAIVEEITTFNKGFKPIGTPYWLSSPDKRETKLGHSQ